MAFNPKLNDFIRKDPDKTLIGFYWSMFWRFYLIVMGTYVGIILVAVILAKLLG
jgi:hypothetical protein